MHLILEFLARGGAFLYTDHDCRIVDSEYIAAFGGTGSVTLRNNIIEVRFWLDRDHLFMDMRATGRTSLDSWLSIDILRHLLNGEIVDSALMNSNNIDFLKENFEQLQELFSTSNLEGTESAGKGMKKLRANRMFG